MGRKRLTAGLRTAVRAGSLGGPGACIAVVAALVCAPVAGADGEGITAGPDGNVWFTEPNINAIGRVTPVGAVTQFLIPNPDSRPDYITAGADGDVWFSEAGSDRIGRIAMNGVISELPVHSGSYGIATGPEGDIWFAEERQGRARIARITPAGALSEFPLARAYREPSALVAGPGADLWFLDSGPAGAAIARITPGGAVAEFPLSRHRAPAGLAAGPEGNLWFTDWGSGTFDAGVGFMTGAGAISEFPLAGSFDQPGAITAGPDGAMWFTDALADEIRRVTPTGVIVEWPVAASPEAIVAGADGSLWFVEESAERVGRITTTGAVSEFPVPPVTRCDVPSLWGHTLARAKRLLHDAHCTLGAVARPGGSKPRLVVSGQSPEPMAVYPEGARVSLRLD